MNNPETGDGRGGGVYPPSPFTPSSLRRQGPRCLRDNPLKGFDKFRLSGDQAIPIDLTRSALAHDLWQNGVEEQHAWLLHLEPVALEDQQS